MSVRISPWMRGWGSRRSRVAPFLRSVPLSSRLTLLGAIFFAFSSLGFISDLMSARVNQVPVVLVNATVAGAIAMVYAYGGATGHRGWLFTGTLMLARS